MKKFIYEARDTVTGRVSKASVQADSETSAAKLLISQNLTPINIKEEVDSNSFLSQLTGRITTKDRVVFTRQLATLIGAGLPITESLTTAIEQTQNKRLQAIVQDVLVSVESGKALSDSFAKHPEIFDKVFLALIAAGEASGTLDDSLMRIASQQEKDASTMSKIKGAMTYPAIVLFVIVAVMVFMMLTIVPQVEKLYKDLKETLPFLTKILVIMSNFFISYWWVILIILSFAIFFFIQYTKTDNGIRFMDTVKLRIPIIGKLFSKLYMARFMRTGQTLLSTGVSMLDMLQLTSVAVNNVLIRDNIVRAAEKVKGGKALSASLKAEPYILTLVTQMIKIGEQSGKIDEMMGKTAQVYEEELDEQIRTISTSIEPVLMVALAIVAGGMIAAILLPIYSLVNSIQV